MNLEGMTVITLWEPWATLIKIGAKKVETRSWNTNHRGPLIIHAAKRWTREQCEYYEDPTTRVILRCYGFNPDVDVLGFGRALCCVNLTDCIQIQKTSVVLPRERYCGNFDVGRFGWNLDMVEVFGTPVPKKGAQGLWTWN